ncbi:hypothetical protein HF313_29900 [Massilia atriviolacea]|uniref:hypothetical protein n=1 Tax=Massilia atriviolacea TaxID=2495579 RepID=UPI0013DFF31C|nr:hypothetical protein [Massilia atriviolacea]
MDRSFKKVKSTTVAGIKKSPAIRKAFYPVNRSAVDAVVAAWAAVAARIRTGAAGSGNAFACLPLWCGFDFLGFFLGQLERERFHSILIFHFRIFLKNSEIQSNGVPLVAARKSYSDDKLASR